jgi:hypothetical protein
VYSHWRTAIASSICSHRLEDGLVVTIGNTAANANKTILDTEHYASEDILRIQFTTEANETLGDCTASFNY